MKEAEFLDFTEAKNGKVVDNKGKVLITCLDRSGSMSGRPFEAVKIGALKIGEALWAGAEKPFERVITLLYDNNIETNESATHDQYKNYVNSLKTRGSTDFKKVFNWLDNFVDTTEDLKEVTIIFFTDGQDTCNGKDKVDQALEQLKFVFETMKISLVTRFLTIGFSASHDAPFMNRIALAGSQIGNFFYIDTSKPDYSADVQNCLQESLDMAMEGGGIKMHLTDGLKLDDEHSLETNYQFADEEVDGMPVINGVTLSCQTIMKTKDVQGLAANIYCKEKKVQYSVNSIKIDDPSEDIRLKARLQHANKQIFDLIQSVQKSDKREESL